MNIPFNKPYFTGKETEYIKKAVDLGHISGNGYFTKKVQEHFKNRYGFGKCLLTTSCTDALEMAAILINTQEGDEIIIPSYTFVTSANAFVLRGAKIVFADSMSDNPNIDASTIEKLITPRTKAIVPVYYAGSACDMEMIMDIANRHNLYVIEDAAQAIDNYHIDKNGKKKALGTFGHLATFSFHETKNIISGEGGMLVVNDKQFEARAEVIWEKGTNRSAYFRGEIDKYGWTDIGSSFLPSEIIAAFLWAQLEKIEDIQAKREEHWTQYDNELKEWCQKHNIQTGGNNSHSTNNAHMYYLVFNSLEERTKVIEGLKNCKIQSVFHYLSLHKSPFYHKKHDGRELINSDKYSDTLLRLPMFYELSEADISRITNTIKECF